MPQPTGHPSTTTNGSTAPMFGALSGTVVVSGGLGGLGGAIATEVVAAGAKVVLTGRRAHEVALEDLNALGLGDRAVYRQLRADDAHATASLFESIDDLTGAVANAAIYRGSLFLDISMADFAEMMTVNLTGSMIFAQAAARRLVALERRGSIVLMSSWAQNVPDYGSTSYCVSKAGLRMMAKVMALELGKHGIRVNTMSPGIVDAGMAQRQIRTDMEYATRARSTVPLDRFQTAEEVARSTRYLLSEDASYITGADLIADGGASLFRRDTKA